MSAEVSAEVSAKMAENERCGQLATGAAYQLDKQELRPKVA